MPDILSVKWNKEEIESKRKGIIQGLFSDSENIRGNTLRALSVTDLELLFRLYDRVFLESWFRDCFPGRLRFSLSSRMTRSAGLTLCPRNAEKIPLENLVLEIRIGVDFLFHYDMTEGGKAVCGIRTGNSLEALLLVFEHELCHAIEFILFRKSSCKGKRFQTLAGNLFGHTESYHRLPTQKQIAKQQFGLKPGDAVSFFYKERRMAGILYGIRKRATVLVRDQSGPLIDSRGIRYSKYYVPLTQLKPE